MEKQTRKLKDFLKAFKDELLNIVAFLDKRDFNRDEIKLIKNNVCDSLGANEEEKNVITGIFGLTEPVKISAGEESVVQNNVIYHDFGTNNSNNDQSNVTDVNVAQKNNVVQLSDYVNNNLNSTYEQSDGAERGKQITKTSAHYNNSSSDTSGQRAS